MRASLVPRPLRNIAALQPRHWEPPLAAGGFFERSTELTEQAPLDSKLIVVGCICAARHRFGFVMIPDKEGGYRYLSETQSSSRAFS